MKYYNTPKKNRSMSVYIILSLCLVAVGIGAKTLMNAVSEKPEENVTSNQTSIIGNVNNVISDITYSDISSKVSSEEPINSEKTEKEPAQNTVSNEPKPTVANYFVLPVTGNIIKSFSDTELFIPPPLTICVFTLA